MEAEKYRLLKQNLFVEGITDNLVMQMDEKYKSSSQRFTRVVKWLRAKVMQLDYHRGSHAHKEAKKRLSARLVSTVDPDALAQLLSTYDVAANLARNSQDWIPRHIFERLAPEMKDALLDIKDELQRDRRDNNREPREYRQRNPNDRSFRPNDRQQYDHANGNQNNHNPVVPNATNDQATGIPKDSLNGAIPKQYGPKQVAANLARHISDNNENARKDDDLSDIDSAKTGPDDDPDSDAIMESAMHVYKSIQDFQTLKDADGGRHIRMVRVIQFTDPDEDDATLPDLHVRHDPDVDSDTDDDIYDLDGSSPALLFNQNDVARSDADDAATLPDLTS